MLSNVCNFQYVEYRHERTFLNDCFQVHIYNFFKAFFCIDKFIKCINHVHSPTEAHTILGEK
jgi:hypothetical protein